MMCVSVYMYVIRSFSVKYDLSPEYIAIHLIYDEPDTGKKRLYYTPLLQ